MEKNTKIIITVLSAFLTLILITITTGILTTMHHRGRGNPRPQNQTLWRLDLLHADELLPSPKIQNFSQRFQSRMQQDVKRVAGLTNMLLSRNGDPSENKSEVKSQAGVGMGQYLVRVQVGNPPQTQHLTIDTGSDITWLQCSDCYPCYEQDDPMYDPAASTSFAPQTCGSKACKLAGRSGSCDQSNNCGFRVDYADHSVTKGIVMVEKIRIGGGVAEVAMGCGRENTGQFTGMGMGGLMGLGMGPMSIVTQLDVGLRDGFSYCLSSSLSLPPGWLEFGPWLFPVNTVWVPLVRNPMVPSLYYIRLIGIAVGDVRLPIPENAFQISTESGDRGVILDSGTVVTRFPRDVYHVLRDEFIAQTKNIPRESAVGQFLDTCYNVANGVRVILPNISFFFPGATYKVGVRGTLIQVNEIGTYCLAFAPTNTGSNLSIIGNTQQAGIQVSYDLRRGLVGFGPTSC